MSGSTLATPAAPTLPPVSRRRRVIGWAAVVAALVVVGIVGSVISISSEWSEKGALDPHSVAPQGTGALAEVLRDHGVEVVVVRDRDAARTELERGVATLALLDTPALSDGALESVTDAAADVVLLDPRSRTLRVLMDGSAAGGFAGGEPVDPACDADAAMRAGAIIPGALFAPGAGVTGCYLDGDGFGLLLSDDGERRVSAVDARGVFDNAHLADAGHASLAVNLLGQHPRVVWYVPGVGDTDLTDANPSLGEQTPSWVTPVIVLLLFTGLAAALWRGRRFGALVTERLPVTVRASETTEGRARLYAQSRDALHAADQLRLAALDRMGRTLALGSTATAAEITDAVAARTGFARAAVRSILIDDQPDSDAQLVALDERIRTLELAVRSAVRPDGTP